MALPQGIYFRGSDNQTDPSNYDAEIATTANYPRTSAQGNSVGWEDALSAVDRDATTDVRLKGIAFISNNGTAARFRIDLPATGDYKVRLAAGDSSFGQQCYVELYDTTTQKALLVDALTSAAGKWIDATGVERTSEADWVSNNALSTAYTFASTILRFKIGFKFQGGNTTIAAAYVEAAGGGTQSFSYTASGGLTFAGTAAQLRALVKTAAGGLTFAGTATKAFVVSKVASGGIVFGGAATVAFHEAARIVQAAGGIVFGGASDIAYAGGIVANNISTFIVTICRMIGGRR